MGIHADWNNLWPDYFTTGYRPDLPLAEPGEEQLVVVDAMLFMYLIPDAAYEGYEDGWKGLQLYFWELLLEYVTLVPNDVPSRVVLFFDHSSLVTEAKQPEQRKRDEQAERYNAKYPMWHGEIGKDPFPEHLLCIMKNRALRAQLFAYLVESALPLYKLLMPNQTLHIEYTAKTRPGWETGGSTVVEITHEGPRTLRAMVPIGEGDLKLAHYVGRHPRARVYVPYYDSDFVPILILEQMRHAHPLRVYLRKKTPKALLQCTARQTDYKNYAYIDLEQFIAAVVDRWSASFGLGGWSRRDVLYQFVLLMMMPKTDFNGNIPGVGVRKLWGGFVNYVRDGPRPWVALTEGGERVEVCYHELLRFVEYLPAKSVESYRDGLPGYLMRLAWNLLYWSHAPHRPELVPPLWDHGYTRREGQGVVYATDIKWPWQQDLERDAKRPRLVDVET